jgi:hypothetical protein
MGLSSARVERETVCDACAGRTLGVCHVRGQADRTRLLDGGSVRRYEPGAMLACEGEPAGFVFSVAEGAVMLFKLPSDGRRQEISFLFKGDFIGLTFGSDYAFAAEALTPVQTCRFPRRPSTPCSPRPRRWRGSFSAAPPMNCAPQRTTFCFSAARRPRSGSAASSSSSPTARRRRGARRTWSSWRIILV